MSSESSAQEVRRIRLHTLLKRERSRNLWGTDPGQSAAPHPKSAQRIFPVLRFRYLPCSRAFAIMPGFALLIKFLGPTGTRDSESEILKPEPHFLHAGVSIPRRPKKCFRAG